MIEILIPDPDFNKDKWVDWSHNNERNAKYLDSKLSEGGVTPSTHPIVVDLCAGAGSIAELLIERGWQPANITCVDQVRASGNLAPEANWYFWNIKALGEAIILRQSIPEEIQIFRQSFDLITLFGGFLGKVYEEAVCSYLIKPSGKVIAISSLRI